MIFRRRPPEPAPTGVPSWAGRMERAGEVARAAAPSEETDDRLRQVHAALARAESDRDGLRETLSKLEPERATRELKDALRARPDPTVEDTPAILALRRRYESIHALKDRLGNLERRIATLVADTEAWSAALVDLSTAPAAADSVRELSEALRSDTEALRAAHEELANLR